MSDLAPMDVTPDDIEREAAKVERRIKFDAILLRVTRLLEAGNTTNGVNLPPQMFIKRINEIVNIELVDVIFADPLLLQEFLVFLVTNNVLRIPEGKDVTANSKNAIVLLKRMAPDLTYFSERDIEALFILDVIASPSAVFDGRPGPIFRTNVEKPDARQVMEATISLKDFYSVQALADIILAQIEEGKYIHFSISSALDPIPAPHDDTVLATDMDLRTTKADSEVNEIADKEA